MILGSFAATSTKFIILNHSTLQAANMLVPSRAHADRRGAACMPPSPLVSAARKRKQTLGDIDTSSVSRDREGRGRDVARDGHRGYTVTGCVWPT